MSHQGALCFISVRNCAISSIRLPCHATVRAYGLNLGAKIGGYFEFSKSWIYLGAALEHPRRRCGKASVECRHFVKNDDTESALKGPKSPLARALRLSSNFYAFLTGKRGGAWEKRSRWPIGGGQGKRERKEGEGAIQERREGATAPAAKRRD